MSLYIIGAEMPTNCSECAYNQKWNFMTESYCAVKKIANDVPEFSVTRPSWCPIREVKIPIIEGDNHGSFEM